MRDLYRRIIASPVCIRISNRYRKIIECSIFIPVFVLIFVTLVLIAISFNRYDESVFWGNVLVEAHGMWFDILVIGVIIFALTQRADNKRERKREIQRYKDEIDDSIIAIVIGVNY